MTTPAPFTGLRSLAALQVRYTLRLSACNSPTSQCLKPAPSWYTHGRQSSFSPFFSRRFLPAGTRRRYVMPLQPGDAPLNGKYRILRLLGRGGFGFVHLAQDTVP